MQKKQHSYALLTSIAILMILFFYTGSIAETKKRLAILDFIALNTSEKNAKTIRDMLEVEVYKSGHYHIVEKDLLQIMLQEQGLNQNTCKDPECAVRIGRSLQVDAILVGSIRETTGYLVSVKLIDVKTGLIEYADTLHLRSIASFEPEVHKLAQSVVARSPVYQKDQFVILPADFTYRGYYLRSIMPGWGQIYAGQDLKGSIIMGAFILASAYSAYAVYDFREKRSEYDSLSAETDTKQEIDDKYDASEKAFRRANISFGMLGLVYLVNWLDILFMSKPEFDSRLTLYQDEDSSISLSLSQPTSKTFEMGIRLMYMRRF